MQTANLTLYKQHTIVYNVDDMSCTKCTE